MNTIKRSLFNKLNEFNEGIDDQYIVLQILTGEFRGGPHYDGSENLPTYGELRVMFKNYSINHYDAVCIRPLPKTISRPGAILAAEDDYKEWSVSAPASFQGRRIMVSDIIGIQKDLKIEWYYKNPTGYKRLWDFPLLWKEEKEKKRERLAS